MTVKRGRPSKPDGQNEFNRLVGERIEQARKEAGVSTGDLARAIGVSRFRLYRYEIGTANPSILSLTRIARKLNIPLTVLLPFPIKSNTSLTKGRDRLK